MVAEPPLDASIEDLANEILLGPAEQVDARFEALCAANERSRAALLRLRADFERGARLLACDTPLGSASVPPPIGPYRFLRKLGEGAFGVVFLAEQQEPVRRHVAIKLLHATVFSQSAMARFLNERETLARMNHPAIAQLFDAGFDARGQPHFVMEYVPGEPLHAFAAGRGYGLEQRLELFLTACEGVAHAHQRGVIHRDLKPHNILVAEVDGRPMPKVIDFGLAKVLDEQARHPTDTMTGALLGTPAYMSPEQVHGSQDVDSRADVYSLGVILYQVLTGELPYPPDAYRTSIARLRAVHDTDPVPASVRAQATGQPFASRLRGDLDWILRRAMARGRDDRYASVGELASDVRRHLAHEPVLAGPPTLGYALRKFVRRHRMQVAAAAVALLALLLGLVVSLELWWQARANAAVAAANLADFWRLADVVALEELVAEEPTLWPSMPERLAAHDDWLARAHALVARRAEHAATSRLLDERRARPAAGERSAEAERGADFLRDRLAKLIAGIDALAADDGPLRDVERRAAFARTVHERTIASRRAAWDAAIATVAAAPRHAGLQLEPIPGLVPLGADPDSGLQEFAHLQSGAVPVRDAHGRLQLADDTCIVLVLVPGGTWTIGTQSDDPAAPRHDAHRTPIEEDLQETALPPFLIGKYELTQGQVRTLGVATQSFSRAGASRLDGGTFTLRHPEESVSPPDAARWLQRFELRLPFPAEWEVAARGGTDGVFGASDAPESLQGHANVADAAMGRFLQGLRPWEPGIDDGFATHAPVGTFRANGFGLHDVLGNVAELVVARGEGTDRLFWFARGGSYQSLAVDARIGAMRSMLPNQTSPEIGIRVARGLPPPPRAHVTGTR